MSGSVTIDDVAKKAGVSMKTVSRVVNCEPNVSAKTREKVQAVISELNYRPNPSARGLASRKSFVIGLLYDKPSPNYLAKLQAGVLEVCQKSGYSMALGPFDFHTENLVEDILNWVRHSNIDGVILTPPLSDFFPLLTALQARRIPVVAASSKGNGEVPSVMIDDEEAAYQMTRHLIKSGHTDIAFVKGHPDHLSTRYRFEGFSRAVAEADIEVVDTFICDGLYDFESGRTAGEALLTQVKRPTAVFASNDDMAAGVMNMAHQLNIKMPFELAVCGFDDTPISQQVWPTMTTIRQPIRQMGISAGEILLKNINAKTIEAEISHHQFELKERGSTQK